MADLDFEQIKKLPPDQRVKVLEQLRVKIEKLINDRKKEIEQAQQLLERAQEELRVLEEIQTPQPKKVTVEDLFGEEKEEKKERLESIARGGIPQPEQIRERFEQKSITDIYQRMNEITGDIRNTGVITQYQENWLRAANYEMQDRERAIKENQYHPTDKAIHQLTAAERIIRQYVD